MPMLSHEGKSERAIDGNTAAAHVAYAMSPAARRFFVGQAAAGCHMAVVVKTVLGSHVGVGEFTTHVSRDFSGDWDVHWGYDLDFNPWLLFVILVCVCARP